MAKLFLHIGPHKTGSTYIQKYCFENRDHLLSLGVNYPTAGRLEHVSPYGQHETVAKVKTLEQNNLDEYFSQFFGTATTLVSSQDFDGLTLEEIKKLGRSLAQVDVRIIYYRRNGLDLLPSHWQEEVKHGATSTLYQFISPHILSPLASKIMNPCIALNSYAGVFGKDRITIVDYDVALQKDGILQPLFELLGIERPPVKHEVINRSLEPDFTEIIRALNIIASQRESDWPLHKARTGPLFLRKRNAPAIRAEISYIAAVIRLHLKPLRISGSFVQSVNAVVSSNYASSFHGDAIQTSPFRELLASNGDWLLDKDASAACERVYQYITAGDTNC
jgi:hypothetical protein